MKTVTGITVTSQDDETWSQQAQQTTIVNFDNVRYPRNLILSTQGLRVSRIGVAVAFTVDALIAAAVSLEPTLSWPPIITDQPANSTAQYGGPGAFAVIATSEISPVTYQWNVSSDGGVTWVPAAGAPYNNETTPTLAIGDASGLNGFQYQCVVTNASGSTTSDSAILTVQDPGITDQPQNQTVPTGDPTSFGVAAFGATSLTYQWKIFNTMTSAWDNLTNAGVYSGVLTNTMVISDVTGLNGSLYKATVTDTAGFQDSNSVLLTVV